VNVRKKNSARLTWDAKPRRIPSPKDIEFQTAEIVFPNSARDQTTIPSSLDKYNIEFEGKKMNRLIWGNNLLAMQALLASGYEGRIGLIYIDPPFWTNENYYSRFEIGDTEINKPPSIIERLAYKDIWEGGIDSFLDMLYPRFQLMRRLLSDDGSIFVHMDYHIGHYAKLIMDEVFGVDNFRNEIIVKRGRKKGLMYQFEKVERMHTSNDTLLWYTKSPSSKFRHPLSQSESVKPKWMSFWSNVDRPTMRYELFGVTPNRGQWKWKRERAIKAVENYHKFEREIKNDVTPKKYQRLTQRKAEFVKNERLHKYWKTNGQELEFIRMREGIKYPEYWVEPREHKLLDNLWIDIEGYDYSSEYPTEKHLELLDRIITSFSNKDDLIADFFAGSGTALVVAEKKGRRWIGCDSSKVAIQVARNRLVQIDSKPFLIENIGNYQRQLIYLSGSRIYEIQNIILNLYGANPRSDYPGLGTREVDEMVELVYVSYPDRPLTARKVEELEALAEGLDGKGYHILVVLGWDYEYNYDELLRERERMSRRIWHTKVVSKTIPLEIYEYLKKIKIFDDINPLKSPIRFYEKPYLKLQKPKIQSRSEGKYIVTLGIDQYVIFNYPIGNEKQAREIQELVKEKPLCLVDYLAIDWNYNGITFNSTWQRMRRVGRSTNLIPNHITKDLDGGKLYNIAMRVVDIFGNDASGTVCVDLRDKK
jgi:DNA modification methylase